MTIDDIIDWCEENGKTDWLKTFASTEKKGKKPTYFQIKKAFATKFMPEILPVAKEKKPTMYDRIAAL
jgi:hypothetical protein